jgi:hypothetical protein
MNRVDVESTAVRAVSYSRESQTLTVWFLSGGVYQYSNVPESLYQKFIDSQPHPWSACGKSIKEYPYQRLH